VAWPREIGIDRDSQTLTVEDSDDADALQK
jgi:hypothetical protein